MIDDPQIPPVGVLPDAEGNARWRVWAPKAQRVELVLADADGTQRRVAMEPEPRGFFACTTPEPEPGQRYAYALDGGETRPDPCSRWQPDGVRGFSAVWFPDRFSWDEGDWSGVDRADLVFYELHVGTFTPEGTFDAIIPRLPSLLELGITAIELMPINQFPGTRSWGYDGVFPFAPQNSYGGPEGLHRLVEACHRQGMAIFLDVVYNHFGPEADYFPEFGPYLTDAYKTAWGPAWNFDGQSSDPVRAMVLENVRTWIGDYRFDGLRLDAADQIYDKGPTHILADVAEAAHVTAAKLGRRAHVFAETDLNNALRFLREQDRGFAHDGHWNDDFHHAVHVVLTGERNGYYSDFRGPEDLAKVFECVFANDGRYSPFRDRRHGAPATEFPGDRFVAFTQNHDQVGNRMKSDRYCASLPPSKARLAAGLLLLAPRLPLLFMGQEYGETNPFPFFCDYGTPELIEAVRKGRQEEFASFGWPEPPPDPVAEATRDAAVLSWSWSDPVRAGLRRLHADLLQLRRTDPTLRDFRHARARLLGDDVLEVIRGGVAPDPTPVQRIYFNLADADRPLPPELATELPAFRSETVDYGASEPDADQRFTHLRPFEFIIYREGAPGTDS